MDTNGALSGKKGRKEFRKLISAKLESTLSEFQSGLKEKKFKAAIKRASKLLASDLFTKKDKNKIKAEVEEPVAEEIGA
jgi:hypothetical protein